MRKYYGEVCNDEDFERKHRVITVEATNVQQAFDRIREKKGPYEMIYQITRDFTDCSLPQPVYDFFNGFSLARSESSSDTWEERTLGYPRKRRF